MLTIGKCIELRKGEDICLIATGSMVKTAIDVHDELKKINISASVINVHTIKPLDASLIIDCATKNKKIVTVEEHNKIGGLGSAVSEVIAQNNLDCALKIIALEDTFSSVVGSQEFLRKFYKLDSETIFSEALNLIDP